MSRRDADRFEQALQQAALGKTVEVGLRPLVETAQLAAALAQPPPAPEYLLAPGRQRFLAEAATLRAQRAPNQRTRLPWALRLGAAFMAAVLVFGMLLGVGQAMADSLPGEPLHGVELALEEVRLTLTVRAHSRAELRLALAEERLDEIASLAAKGQRLDAPTLARAEEQLMAALREAAQVGGSESALMFERLERTVRHSQRTMAEIVEDLPELDKMRFREMIQAMEQVRQAAEEGQADPETLRERLHKDAPPAPAKPSNAGSEAEPSGVGPGTEPDPDTQPGLGPRPTDEAPGRDEKDTRPGPHETPTTQEEAEDGDPTEPASGPTAEPGRDREGRGTGPRLTGTVNERNESDIGPRPGPRATEQAIEANEGSASPKLTPQPTGSGSGVGESSGPGPQPPSEEGQGREREDEPGAETKPPNDGGEGAGREDNPGPQPPGEGGGSDGGGDDGSGPGPQLPDGDGEGDERDGSPGPQPPGDEGAGDRREGSPGTGSQTPGDGDGEKERDDDPGSGSQPPGDQGRGESVAAGR